MAKRFTETGKWADPWFQDLRPAYKCAWSYILDSCDNAGIWIVNTKLLSFQIGEGLSWIDLKETMGDRLVEFAPGKVWVPKFIDFQYGTLTQACKPHQKVIGILKGYGLWEPYQERLKGYAKGMDTLEEEEEEEDKEEEKEEEGGPGETKPLPLPPKQTEYDRALAVLELYPTRAKKDGRVIRKDLAAQNVLAAKIRANPDFPWEEAATLEGASDTPRDAHGWAMVMPDTVALASLRKAAATPPPPKPGDRPRKASQALT